MDDAPARGAGTGTTAHRPPSKPPRLNLFAFPSLTTLLFGLIAGVILVAVCAGLRQSPSALGLMLVLGMVVLPVRGFLRQVDGHLSRLGVGGCQDGLPPPELVAQLEEAATALGVRRPPCLLVVPGDLQPSTIGSWRRRYVALGRPQADCLAALPGAARRTLWLHEVAHFANGDHWKVGLAGSLLRTTVAFMSWAALFLLGVVLMALLYGFELFEPGFLDSVPIDPALRGLLAPMWPDPALTAPMLDQARAIHPGLASLYVLNACLPFVFSGLLLMPFVWRRLVQVREFYADARVAAQVQDGETARQALAEVADRLALGTGAGGEPGSPASPAAGLRGRLAALLRFHPTWPQRFRCLNDPSLVFGSSAWAGLIAGLAVLLLDLILVGPFTLGYLSGGPVHFVTLSGFLILGVWLVPGVCRGFASTGALMRRVAGAALLLVGLRAAWLLLNSALVLALLVLDPGLLHTLLNAAVLLSGKVLSGSAPLPLPQEPATLAAWAIGGSWGLTLLAGLSLLLFLSLAGLVLRWLLTWYALPRAERRLLRIAWGVLLVLALVLGAIVLPAPAALIQGDLPSVLQPAPLALMGVAGLCALAGGAWFFHHNRRYARLCPTCRAPVPGWFEPGKQCPACGQTLHPWLLAGY